MDFQVQIPNLSRLTGALAKAPEIAAPILQRALQASQAILAKYTTKQTVPWRTGFLVQSFRAQLATGKLTWYPTASYARFVEFGTAPHRILPKDRLALYWPGAEHPVRAVSHPGSKANRYMERIIEYAQDDITSQFNKALQQITDAIAGA